MVATPSNIIFISNPERDLSKINLQDLFGANLYSSGLNVTPPGIVEPGTPQPISSLQPLSPAVVSLWRWLDFQRGWMIRLCSCRMNTTQTYCAALNVPPANPNIPVTPKRGVAPCVIRMPWRFSSSLWGRRSIGGT